MDGDAAGKDQNWPTWWTEEDMQWYQQGPDDAWKDDRGEGNTKEGETKKKVQPITSA